MISNHENLQWQHDWAGTKLINKRILVSADELDEPQQQLRTVVLPVDPPSIMNARPEGYFIDEQTHRRLMTGGRRFLMDGTSRIESNSQSGNTQ